MSDLVDRISTVGRSLPGSPFTGSDPTRRSPTPPGHAWMASAHYPLASTTLSSLALERFKTAKSSNLPLPTAVPLRRSLRLEMKRNPSLHGTDSRFLNSPVEEEEEEEVGFRPLKVIGVSRQLVYGHFVYDTSSTDISSTDISSTITFLAEIEAGVMQRILYH